VPLPLILLGEVDSTQAFLSRHPELGFCGVLAASQTLGQGTRGRTWESALGAGLWLSAAVPVPAVAPGLILQRAMAAVAEVLEPCGATLGLKWPNDLVAWHQGRLVKLGGIIGIRKDDRLLLGAGVNLLSAPSIPDRAIPPACMVEVATNPVPHAQALARRILDLWQDLSVERAAAFRWPEAGDAIRWEEGQGICKGWLPDGRLAVETREGVQNLTGGDVTGLGEGD
jgi:BirA family biotin operon repressor/biotin-[acetyl-CoA-carboxylase] ligase